MNNNQKKNYSAINNSAKKNLNNEQQSKKNYSAINNSAKKNLNNEQQSKKNYSAINHSAKKNLNNEQQTKKNYSAINYSDSAKKNLLLINPWIADFAAYDLWAKPLGLLYIGEFLKTYDYEIELIDLLDRYRWNSNKDANINDGRGKYQKTLIEKPELLKNIPRNFGLYGATKNQFQNALKKTKTPDAILLTSHMTYWYIGIIKTIEVIKQFYPKTPIILGGIYVSLYPNHAKNLNVDYIITGYGEKQSLKLLDKLFNIVRDYSEIPETNDKNIPPWYLYQKLDAVSIMTSRGCPNNCSYCATNQLHPKFTHKNPRDVINEIIEIHNKYNINHFAFYDDALFTDKEKYIIPILQGIIDSGIKVNFHSPNGLFAKEINQKLALLMKKSGFKIIRLSLESIISKWQKASSYKVSQQDFINAVENLTKAGFQNSEIEAYLIMGLPGQTPKDILESLQFVAENGAISRLASYTPIPGTKDWKEAEKMGYISESIDPILTNNTLSPCASEIFPIEKFLEIKQYSLMLNEKVRKNNKLKE